MNVLQRRRFYANILYLLCINYLATRIFLAAKFIKREHYFILLLFIKRKYFRDGISLRLGTRNKIGKHEPQIII